MNIGSISMNYVYPVSGSYDNYRDLAVDSPDKANALSTNAGAMNKVDGTSSPEECQTCKERKYQDGSNENVSYKAASHISPDAAASAVRSHEGEHVSNAYTKASEKNGEVVSASVSIHTSICPECGRTYVSGGTTSTQIKYSDTSNPYQQNQKSLDALRLIGSNVDYAA